MRVIVVLALVAMAVPLPVGAQETNEVLAETVEIIPVEGGVLALEETRHRGTIIVSGHDDGLAVAERTTVDTYLEGIAEVPFGWHPQALAAQAIAARTYLAWTLSRGRSSNGARYGYDICATVACQVYAGIDLVEGPQGERWRQAVESTRDQILVYQGRPAQTLYSSSSGGRTRNVEDVFVGSAPQPYLRAVDSPNEDSSFGTWQFTVTAAEAKMWFGEAGLAEGEIVAVENIQPPDGEGTWKIRIVSEGADTTTGTWELRSALNAAAPILGDRLPAVGPNGRRYPQTILSPNVTITQIPGWRMTFVGPPIYRPSYLISGNGWGHNLGMSQYGAQAMAQRGATHQEILAHYFGGLTPQPAGDLLAGQVVVGLDTKTDRVAVRVDGAVTVTVDGEVLAENVLGDWSMTARAGGVALQLPPGLGLAPRIEVLRWSGEVVFVRLNTTARVAVDGRSGEVRRPGILVYRADDDLSIIRIEADNPQGHVTMVVRVPRE